MALILLNTNDRPLGQFDSLDGYVWKGGECATLGAVSTAPGTDKAAADVNDDGYVPDTSPVRPCVIPASSSSSVPIFLTDDGTGYGYGTLFGVVVGSFTGQVSYGPNNPGPNLGPPTYAGSGKVTLWMQPGLYGVTLDAVDTSAGGLLPTNTSLTVGSPLYYTSAGLLTTSANKVSGGPVVGYLSEFATNGSFVTTQPFMVQALNSPSGDVASNYPVSEFTMAQFYFLGPAS